MHSRGASRFQEPWLRALEELDPEIGTEASGRALGRLLPPEEARRARELLDLRLRARGRLPRPETLLLTRKGLEQATPWGVALARAGRIAAACPGALLLDATVGVGGDALAAHGAGVPAVGADLDPEHARCAAHNLERAGAPARVLVADALRPAARADLLLLDPDRRPGGARTLDPARWSPGLERCLELAARFDGACLKLAPALDVERVTAGGERAWQWTSLAGGLVETALWTGALARGRAAREVLALDAAGAARSFAGEPLRAEPLAAEEARRAAWLFEPDPALVRSGLLGSYAAAHGLRPLGPGIAFLAGDGPRAGADLLAALRVLDVAPADPKRVRAMLRRHDVGEVEILKRGHPLSAGELARALRGKGARRGTLAVARLARGHAAFLVERARAAPPAAAP